jgi:O-antigen/teichoic acid export membrane protein
VSADAAWPTPQNDGAATTAVAAKPAHEADLTKLASGAGVALMGKVVGRGIRLMGDILMARLLGPASFGLYAIGWTVSRIVTLVTPMGLNIGVIRYGSRYWRKDPGKLKGVIRQSLSQSFLFGAAVGLLFYLASPWIGAKWFDKPEAGPVIGWFALGFPLMTGLTVSAAATRISHRMKFGTIAEDMAQPISDVIMIVGFYLLGGRLGGAVLACVLSFGVAFLIGLRYVWRLYPELRSSTVKAIYPGKELLAFSIPASLTGVFGVLLIWVDRLFVGYYRPAAEVGIYQAASQLSVTFALILSAFNTIFSPMAADLYHHGELGRLEELYRVSTKWGLYLSIPPFLVTCFTPKLVMGVLFGKAYVDGWMALLILTFGQVINAGTGPVGYLLVMAGYQKRMFQISGTTCAAAIILGLLLVPRYGMTGAAIATGLALAGMFISAVLFARHALHMVPYDKRYLKGFLATLLGALALFPLRNVHIGPAWVTVTIQTLVAVGVFFGTLLVLGLDLEDRKFIGLIRQRIAQQAFGQAKP